MKLIAYTRVSTDDQANGGISLETQEARLRGWAALMGNEIVAVYTDVGLSGALPPTKRAGFAAALERLRGAIDIEGMVAVSLDRFSRSVIDIQNIVKEFSKRSWALLSLRETLDPTTPLGRLFLTFLSGLAQYEQELVGERTAVAMQQLKRTGQRYGSIAPWGKRFMPDGTVVVADEEVAVQKCASSLHIEGKNAWEIACELNDRLMVHPRSKKEWTEVMVRGLLKGLRRCGMIPPAPRRRVRWKPTDSTLVASASSAVGSTR